MGLLFLITHRRGKFYRFPAGNLLRPTRIHAAQHGLLGILGKHHQADSGLAHPALLLGLRHRYSAGQPGLGSHPGRRSGSPVSQPLPRPTQDIFCLAVAGGIIFNAANLLLVVAIEIAGLAVAFPLGIGLALVIGVLLNYAFSPAGNAWLLFIGVGLVAVAIVIDAIAYRRREQHRTKITARGILLSLLAGVLMGLFYPLGCALHAWPRVSGALQRGSRVCRGHCVVQYSDGAVVDAPPTTRTEAAQHGPVFCGAPALASWGLIGGAVWCSGSSA